MVIMKENKNNIKFYNFINKYQYKNRLSSSLFRKINSNKFLFNLYFIFFTLTILISSIPKINSFETIELRHLSYDNYIIITIAKHNKNRIISYEASKDIWPNKIKINTANEITNNIQSEYNLPDEINTIIMTWNSPLTSCKNMFKNVPYIKSIDLTHFDFSQVITMESFFEGCLQVQSIDMKNGQATKVENITKMFLNCNELTNIDFTNFKTGSLKIMESTFSLCSKLQNLDLSSFETTYVTNMDYLFYQCTSLKSLNLSNFYTPALTTMDTAFFSCESLESLDISNFNTDKVEIISQLFKGCYSLKYLDLRNFNTSSVVDMADVFWDCHALTSIEISSFDTSKVTNMGHMFYECRSLKSLNLSHFKTPIIKWVDYMFYNCHSLEYLDIINFNTENAYYYVNMFFNTTSLISLNLTNFKVVTETVVTDIIKDINPNVILCYNESQVTPAFLEEVRDHENSCKKVCALGPRIYIEEVDKCVDNCYHSGTNYKYEYNRKCYTSCPERTKFYSDSELCEDCRDYYNYNKTGCLDLIPDGYYNNDTISKTIDKCPIECKTCSLDSIKNNLCISCNNDNQYYYILNDSLNTDLYYKCYYKDEIEKYYYLENNIFKSCYSKCKICNSSGTNENNNCIECKDDNYYELINGNCIRKQIDQTENESFINLTENNSHSVGVISDTNIFPINNKDELIKMKISNIISNYISLELENENYVELMEENILFEMSTTKNEKSNVANINNKNVTIDLGDCEYFLKKAYNISYNDSLYIIKILINEEGMKIPKVEYEVYYPLYNQSLIKLNLELCKNNEIEVTIPIIITEDIDKYNPNSEYYNDICSKDTSKSGTDITLNDRKYGYINDNMTLCEEHCQLIDYNNDTKKVKCSCNMKTNIPLIDDIKFNKNELFKRFNIISNIINVKVMKCLKAVYSHNLIYNYGFFIMLCIMILFIICIIIFSTKSYNNLKLDINEIVIALKSKKEYAQNKLTINNKRSKDKNKNRNKSKRPVSISNYLSINRLKDEKMDDPIIKNDIKLKRDAPNLDTQNKNLNEQLILEYKDFELNLLEYKQALKSDKRTYFQCYFSLLKNRHILPFSFWNFKDYNSRIIKIFLFFFFYGIHLTVNALFFNDSAIHKIYEDKGSYNFVYQIPRMLYSSIIALFINGIFKYLPLSQKNITLLKSQKKDLVDKKRKLLNVLKVKFIIFFIILLVLCNLFLWYIFKYSSSSN